MRTLVIGDVHGCFDELRELLHRAALTEDDRIVAVGDLVDRGPATPFVLDFFEGHGRASVVLGNHERKHVRAARGEIAPALSQLISREQIGEARYPAAIAFMATLPGFIELPEAIVIHGYLEPGLPLDAQKDTVLAGTMSGARRLERYPRPWYELYDGEKPVIAGHQNYGVDGRPLVYRDLVYGIDTDCCRGGALTGVLLPEFEVLSVPARADHWSAVKTEYLALRHERTADDELTWEAADAIAARKRSVGAPPGRDRAEQVEALLGEGEGALRTLRDRVVGVHANLIAAIGHGTDPTARQLAKAYAAAVEGDPLSAMLFEALRDKLTIEALRRRFRGPVDAVEFVTSLPPDR